MQYSVVKGVENSWRERALAGLTVFTQGRNWLPIAVGTITALWLCLLGINLLQTTPQSPGATGHSGKPKAGQSLNVSYANKNDSTASSPQAANSHSSSMQASSPSTSPTTPTTNQASSTPTDVIGGKGADTTPATVPQPVTTPSITPPTTDGDAAVSLDLPLLDPITVDVTTGNNGTGLTLGL